MLEEKSEVATNRYLTPRQIELGYWAESDGNFIYIYQRERLFAFVTSDVIPGVVQNVVNQDRFWRAVRKLREQRDRVGQER